MSAIVTKATSFVNCAINKTNQLASGALYWGKVTAEIGKVVSKNEGLAPPSTQQFQTFYQNAFKFVQSPAQQKAFLESAAKFRPGKQCAVKAAVYGTQLLAFFSVGEIIGRRNVFGYPAVGGHH
ncbi:Protein associated with mitochondrial ATP Synthase essential for dimeric state of ATP synthase [Scheffersomyces stipitis CBS 6054]|uniref:Protein associated with mitochondrial ATP Synthase essential for dimeric state of ATP synthase n=1 Tax=Scheffersomyces stipitis (strain ATCC 58785 / CBS 6054 / NBRC 10063 / NRRL Y-11545) TaxID=322104 RepID=A3GHX0_PICST|nr:Protein associated with mitochondrial ATP Synthase essential for dimeric state of ATP synthase [Scheffersomyces stipitis CBS 6054]EAZ63128.1 Protein associated with mitochondrial ATP Synthase essential for dimeric state of ATP synthase [Scheffersomyces stipitis CBS 6054]KAG2735518.1 hypothetical protein G9P44_001732 [Scheffersomyces stipitis]